MFPKPIIKKRVKAKRKKSPREARTHAIKKLIHTLWSKLVRRRDGACVLCGVSASQKQLYAHHWIVHAAGSIYTRFILNNGVALCYSCHIFKVHSRGDAGTLDEIREYMRRFMRDWEYDEINKRGHQPNEVTLEDLEAKMKYFKEQLGEE